MCYVHWQSKAQEVCYDFYLKPYEEFSRDDMKSWDVFSYVLFFHPSIIPEL